MESRGHRGCGGGVVALAGAIVAVALISGCGGGGGSATGEGKPKQPLSRATLIAKADATCVWSRHALRRAAVKSYKGTRFENPTERLPWPQYSEAVVAIARKTVRQLKELEPPPGLRSAFEAYVGAEEEVKSLAEQALEAAEEDNDAPYYRARKTRDAGVLERYDLARKVGLKECSPFPFG